MNQSLGPLATPLLTSTDEVRLARQIEAGKQADTRIQGGLAEPGDRVTSAVGRSARQRFIEANIGLVLRIAAGTRIPDHVDRDDVVQDGMLGLERAVAKFDWRKGYKFSTYATWWIRQSIQRGMENTLSTVRIPAHRTSELRGAADRDSGISDRSPALAAAAALAHLDSIHRRVGSTNRSVGDLIPDERGHPDREVEARADREAIGAMIAQLDPTTARVVVARFGLDGAEPATFAAIGAELGVSPEAVRRRVMRALDRLRPMAEQLVVADNSAVLAA